jgi:hypothetical protein
MSALLYPYFKKFLRCNISGGVVTKCVCLFTIGARAKCELLGITRDGIVQTLISPFFLVITGLGSVDIYQRFLFPLFPLNLFFQKKIRLNTIIPI